MREAVHIFLKDTRHLRFQIAMLLAWTVLFMVASAASTPPYLTALRHDGSRGLLEYLVRSVSTYVLPMAWWFLISQAFHADALPGDRQFWITRPYRRASLFWAKALFVLAYITLPLALAQGAIVALRGFPLGSSLPGIIWTQVLILAIVVLPAAGLASLTSTLARFVAVGLAAPLLFYAYTFLTSLTPWEGLAWIRASVAICAIVAVTGAVLFLQFTHRRTGTSRVIAIAGILAIAATLPLLPWRTAFAFQSHLTHTWDGTLTAELVGPQPKTALSSAVIETGPIQLVFRIAGPPAGTPIICDAVEVTVQNTDGLWNSGLVGLGTADSLSRAPDGCTAFLRLHDGLLDRIADRPANLHVIVYVTVFGPERATSVGIDQPPTFVPNAGVCGGTTDRRFTHVGSETVDHSVTPVGCQAAFRAPRDLVLFSAGGTAHPSRYDGLSYSPFPADLRIQAIEDGPVWIFSPPDAVTITTRAVAGHIKTVVDLRDVRLTDFQWIAGR